MDTQGSRYHPMHRAAFGPIWGSGCPAFGACGCGRATGAAEEFTCQLGRLAQADIPITAYLFDGSAWSRAGSDARSGCQGPDCCQWKLGDQVIVQLATSGVRGLVHFWGGCHDEVQYGRVASRLGRNLLGFYLDDGSSDAELSRVSQFMESVSPGDWEVFAKAFQNREPSTTAEGLGRWANTAYVGDLPVDYAGLHEAVARVVSATSLVPAPLAELTGYDYPNDAIPAEEVYYRRLHFGAVQPVMAHTPFANADPWRPEYGPGLLRAYRYWAWFHKELVPYFYSLGFGVHEGAARALVQPGPMPDSLLVGDALYAPIVTASVERMDIELPAGEWVDYWDEGRVYSGTIAGHPVPLGREPIFIRQGAILPLDVENDYTGRGTRSSRGSLTVAVYPDEAAASSFRYRQDALSPWITFTSQVSNQRLTLTADPALPAEPVLYRVSRWNGPPGSVGQLGATLTVNQGGEMGRADTEAEAAGSDQSAWYYDASTRRLTIKVVP